MSAARASTPARDRLWLADWRRRIAELYAEIRATSATDPHAAWNRWRTEREALFRSHPQSPIPPAERDTFRARHWPYDAALRFVLCIEPAGGGDATGGGAPAPIALLPSSGDGAHGFTRIGLLALAFPDRPRHLAAYWLTDYAGGLFVAFRDGTSGAETYGAGRYVLDTAKGADLGGDPADGSLVVDLNFAYHPSCAFDSRWACPLAGPDDRLDLPVHAGERLR